MAIFKKFVLLVLRISISIALLIFLFHQIDKGVLLEIIKSSDKKLLLFAFLIFSLTYPLCLYRWEMLLKASEIRLPLKRIITAFSAGIFFSLLLPSTIGGDLVRTLDLASHTKKPRQILTTVILDRLSGYAALASLAVIAVFLGLRLIKENSVIIAVSILTAVLIGLLLVLFNSFVYGRVNKFLRALPGNKIMDSISNLHQDMYYFRRHKNIILGNFCLSLLIQIISPVTFYIIALALGIKSLDIMYFFIFLPIIGAITLLPITIGGLGLRDASTVFFFSKAGLAKDLAFSMSLISFFFLLVWGSIGGLYYVLTIHYRRIQHHKSPSL